MALESILTFPHAQIGRQFVLNLMIRSLAGSIYVFLGTMLFFG
jgi:hypothetical protein